jgi:hypothetical protein
MLANKEKLKQVNEALKGLQGKMEQLTSGSDESLRIAFNLLAVMASSVGEIAVAISELDERLKAIEKTQV